MTYAYQNMVSLSPKAWRHLSALNAKRGHDYIKAYAMCRELEQFIALHQEGGVELDGKCLELMYEDGVCLIIRSDHGMWTVTDIWAVAEAIRYIPRFVWNKVRRGAQTVLTRVLTGWRTITAAMADSVLDTMGHC